MKVLKKATAILVVASMVILLTAIKSYATLTCELQMTSATTKLQAGETVTISVSAASVGLTESAKGVSMFDGYLEYDSEIFEEVKKGNFDGGDDRTVTYTASTKRVYVEADNDAGLIKNADDEIFNITLKVKADANLTEPVTVSYKNVEITDNITQISGKIASITFGAGEAPATEAPSTEAPATEAPTATATATSLVINPSTATPKPNATVRPTVAPTKAPLILPQTGIGGISIGLILGALAVCGFAGFKLFKSDI